MAVEVVWTILRQKDRFLLAQRSTSDIASNTWVFPGGKVDPKDQTLIDTAARELKKEVGLDGGQFKKLCSTHVGKYNIHVFYCKQWSGKPKPNCNDIIGIGWFTFAEIYALDQSLAPLMNNSLLHLSYLIQHYDHHQDEWHEQWRRRDGNG